MPECQNCGNEVSHQYVRVFEPEGNTQAQACPDCPDLVRGRNGVRKARASRE